MAFTRIQNDRITQDGKVWAENGQWKWANADGDQAIVVGEYIVWRLMLTIPKGSTIYSAKFQAEYLVKNGDTVPQSFSYWCFMEINAPEYPMTTDTYIGPTPGFPPLPRISTRNGTSGTLTYSVNTPEADSIFIELASTVQEIVNRDDYEPGQYVSVILQPTAESGDISLRMRNHDFASPHPNLQIEYVDPMLTSNEDRAVDINLMEQSTFELDVEDMFVSEAYGYYVATTTYARSTEQKKDSANSLKVTSGPAEAGKNYGIMSHYTAAPDTSYVFSGWIYVPSTNTGTVIPQFQYVYSDGQVTERDKWVPFVCGPYTTGGDPTALWPGVKGGDSRTGNYFYLDKLALYESKVREMPFNGWSPDNLLMDYKFNQSHLKGNSSRITRARTQTMKNNLRVMNDMNSTSGWTKVTSNTTSTPTYSLFNGGVRVSMSSTGGPISTETLRWTGNLDRFRRFLAVNRVGVPITLSKIIRNGRPDIINPRVVRVDGDRAFYDVGDSHGQITALEFTVAVNTTVREFTVYDLSETSWPTFGESELHPNKKYVKNAEGFWIRADSQRTSPTWNEYSSMTWDQLEATGKTWDQMEADATI